VPLRTCLDCGALTPRSRCPDCERTSTRNHRGVGRQARGYGREYEHIRADLVGRPCVMGLPGCTGVATTAQHQDGVLVPACAHCNYADGARRMRG